MYKYYKITVREHNEDYIKHLQRLGYKLYHQIFFKKDNIELVKDTLFIKKEQINEEDLDNQDLILKKEAIEKKNLPKGLVKIAVVDEEGRMVLDPNDPEDRAWFED